MAVLAAAVFAAVALAAFGELTQKPGTAGCISDEGFGPCVDGKALDHARAVTVSPDGSNVYGVKYGAIAIFDRDVSTGGLGQKPGQAGCIGSADGFSGPNPGLCPDGIALDGADSVTVSPDGANVYVASSSSDAVAIFDRDPSNGSLTQESGSGACISETGASPCADGTALDGANTVAVSPDGANAYVASSISKAVAVFDRDPTSGALTQQPGTAGCISETGTEGACADGVELHSAGSVTVSPDGANAYVSSSTAVTIFDRDPSSGSLTQKAGLAGCVSQTGETGGGCVDGYGLGTPTSVAVSPDGTSAYVASYFPGAVAILDRNPGSGELTQKAGTAGCIGQAGGGGGTCVPGQGLGGASSVVVSPDGASVYVASRNSDAIAIFDRDPTSGALTQKPGTAGCISDTGSAGTCVDGTALSRLLSVAISPDGASVYTASNFNHAVAIFDRATTGGAPPDPTPPPPSVLPTPSPPGGGSGNALACKKAKRNHVKAKQRLGKLKRNDAAERALAKARQKIRQTNRARLRTCR